MEGANCCPETADADPEPAGDLGNLPPPPLPPAGTAGSDEDSGTNLALVVVFSILGSVAVAVVLVALSFRWIKLRQSAAVGPSFDGSSARMYAKGSVAVGNEFGLGVYYGHVDGRPNDAAETTPLRFDLGSVLAR